MAIFKRFFGTDNPYEALMVIQDAFEKMGGSGKPELGAQRTYDLPVTLEEIFHGAHKAVTHTRKVQREANGSIESEDRTLTVAVPPGCKNGRRFVFEREGNSNPASSPEPSSLYSRRLGTRRSRARETTWCTWRS